MAQAKIGMVNPKMLQRITGWLGLLAVLALASLAVTIYQIAREIDREAMQKDRTAIDTAVTLLNEKFISDFTNYYYSDFSYRTFVRNPTSAGQTDELVADGTRDPSKEYVSIVAPNGVVTYSTRTKGEDRSGAADELLAKAADEIAELKKMFAKNVVPDREGGFRFELQGHDTINDDTGIADIAILDGRPALMIVSAIVPDDAELLIAAEPTVAIDVIFLDEAAYDILAAMAHVRAVRPALEGENDPVHMLKDSNGEQIMAITWTFDAPGQRIISGALPVFLAAFALFLVAVGIATVTLRRFVKRLAEGEAAAFHAAPA